MDFNDKGKYCSNCGALLTREICPYCDCESGLSSSEFNMEYPVIECKEANINFWNVFFPMIFAVAFVFFGIMFPLVFWFTDNSDFLVVGLLCCIFTIVGVIFFVVAIKPIIRFIKIKLKGKEIEATVYGYMDDNLTINGKFSQIVKLLVSTDDGLKFILYQLFDVKQPFRINSKIKLRVYKDMFLIIPESKYYF